MSQTSDVPLTAQLFRLADLATPHAVRAAATLGIADHMPASLADLAKQVGADPGALGQLLRHLVARGLLVESAAGTFEPTELGALLRSDHPLSMRADLDMDTGGLATAERAFVGLTDAVRTGRAAYQALFGRTFWEDLAADPQRGAAFDRLLASKPPGFVTEVATGYTWPGTRVVDVGGGSGGHLIAVLATRPDLRGALVERPATAEAARVNLARAGLADRTEVIPGDFFAGLPAGDVYLLVNILHDWNDEDALRILRRCADAGGPGARMLIVERLDAPEDYDASAMDLLMLVMFGGRQRTLDDFRGMAEMIERAARLVGRTSTGMSLIEYAPSSG